MNLPHDIPDFKYNQNGFVTIRDVMYRLSSINLVRPLSKYCDFSLTGIPNRFGFGMRVDGEDIVFEETLFCMEIYDQPRYDHLKKIEENLVYALTNCKSDTDKDTSEKLDKERACGFEQVHN